MKSSVLQCFPFVTNEQLDPSIVMRILLLIKTIQQEHSNPTQYARLKEMVFYQRLLVQLAVVLTFGKHPQFLLRSQWRLHLLCPQLSKHFDVNWLAPRESKMKQRIPCFLTGYSRGKSTQDFLLCSGTKKNFRPHDKFYTDHACPKLIKNLISCFVNNYCTADKGSGAEMCPQQFLGLFLGMHRSAVGQYFFPFPWKQTQKSFLQLTRRSFFLVFLHWQT